MGGHVTILTCRGRQWGEGVGGGVLTQPSSRVISLHGRHDAWGRDGLRQLGRASHLRDTPGLRMVSNLQIGMKTAYAYNLFNLIASFVNIHKFPSTIYRKDMFCPFFICNFQRIFWDRWDKFMIIIRSETRLDGTSKGNG